VKSTQFPFGIFWVYLPQIIVLTPLPKIRCYISPSHTISSILAHLSFRNYNAQFLFTVLLGILSECFIVIAFCACTMSKRRRKQRVCDPIYCDNPFCPQDGKEYSSMSAFTQHIGRSISCQQFVQGHLVGTASLLCMTSNNAEASSVVHLRAPICRIKINPKSLLSERGLCFYVYIEYFCCKSC
jgi:hypothetical protein